MLLLDKLVPAPDTNEVAVAELPVEEADDVAVGSVIELMLLGIATLAHLVVALEAVQQVSSELCEQYLHIPKVLLPYPQLLGSFTDPWTQFPCCSDSAGRAQLVKSARI